MSALMFAWLAYPFVLQPAVTALQRWRGGSGLLLGFGGSFALLSATEYAFLRAAPPEAQASNILHTWPAAYFLDFGLGVCAAALTMRHTRQGNGGGNGGGGGGGKTSAPGDEEAGGGGDRGGGRPTELEAGRTSPLDSTRHPMASSSQYPQPSQRARHDVRLLRARELLADVWAVCFCGCAFLRTAHYLPDRQ